MFCAQLLLVCSLHNLVIYLHIGRPLLSSIDEVAESYGMIQPPQRNDVLQVLSSVNGRGLQPKCVAAFVAVSQAGARKAFSAI